MFMCKTYDDTIGNAVRPVDRQKEIETMKKAGIKSCKRVITLFKDMTDTESFNNICKVIMINSSISDASKMIFGDLCGLRRDDSSQHFMNVYTFDCYLDNVESKGIESQFLNGNIVITSMKTIHRHTDYTNKTTSLPKTPNLFSDDPALINYRVTDVIGLRDVSPLIDPRFYTQEHEFYRTGDCNEYGIVSMGGNDIPNDINGRDLIDPFTKVFVKDISKYQSTYESYFNKQDEISRFNNDGNIANETIDMVNFENNHGDSTLIKAQFIYDSLTKTVKHDNQFMFDGGKYMLKEAMRDEIEAVTTLLMARGMGLERRYGNIIIFYKIDTTGSYCSIVLRDYDYAKVNSSSMNFSGVNRWKRGNSITQKNQYDEITNTIMSILDFDNNSIGNTICFNPFNDNMAEEHGLRSKYGILY